jgi:hypothetical protein
MAYLMRNDHAPVFYLGGLGVLNDELSEKYTRGADYFPPHWTLINKKIS